MPWEWEPSILIAIGALLVSAAGYVRARSADKRSGAALVEVEVLGKEISEVFYGWTRLRVTNAGPAVANKITVVVLEDPQDAQARRGFRNWRTRWRLHRTRGPKRLGIEKSEELLARGLTDDVSRIWVRWNDAAGRHFIHPAAEWTPNVF